MNASIKVLHVVESFGGGVATALAQYAEATPEVEHHLLRGERPGDFIDEGELGAFATVKRLPRNPFRARRVIRSVTRQTNPAVVHAHSSFGGAYVRLSLRSSRKTPIVYTPHGFSFERGDISAASKLAFLAAETLLSKNTAAYAACSPREAELSHFRNFSGDIVHVPNVVEYLETQSTKVDTEIYTNAAYGTEDLRLSVVSVGRLTPARDPLFFAEVVRIVQSRVRNIDFTWVGGGDEKYAEVLRDLGVHVTGWLPRSEAMAILSSSDLHVHTASWDGFPMVLLEANARRIPSLVRTIVPFSAVPSSLCCETPAAMAERILGMRQPFARTEPLGLWDNYLADNKPHVQRERLMALYTQNPIN